MPTMKSARLAPILVVIAVASLVPLASAFAGSAVSLPDRKEAEDALPEGGALTGREIFDRFLENRLHSAVQYQTVFSRDPGGNEQRSRFWVRWKDYRDKDKKAVEGVLAKTLVKFEAPDDMRLTGFLMVVNEDRSNDQFVWTPSTARVRRVQLRGVGVMGTDYTFDDISWKNAEDADYERLADEEIEGTPVYVVEVTMKPFVQSQYKTMRTWIEKEHFIPLRSLYRDENGVEIREMKAPASGIRDFNGTWVASESTMYNLKEKTSTKIIVDKLDANATLADRHFSTFQLTLRH
jgi:Outer membrane lipoprotein-sorting protein